MAKDDKSRLVGVGSSAPRSTPEDLERILSVIKPMRSPEELEPIVQRVAANPEVMKKFQAAAGSEDQALAEAAIEAVFAFAKTIDSQVTRVEATSVTVSLMKMMGQPGERQ
jgi:hypothetical protein